MTDAPPYCDDWRCPSRDYCQHFFGASWEYAAMWRADEPWRTPIKRRDREDQVVCGDFLEEDLPVFTRRRFAPGASRFKAASCNGENSGPT
jgi:hypothetical protein